MKSVAGLRKELARYGKKIYDAGLVIGSGGNISARSGRIALFKASGACLGRPRPGDYIGLDLGTGKRTGAPRARFTVELPMHLACYGARPDIGAVVHFHPVCGTAASLLTRKLGLISYEFAVAMSSEVPTVKYLRSGTGKLAAEVAKAIAGHNGALLKNLGAIVVGKDLEEAFNRAMALERACRVFVLSKIAGRASLIPRSELKKVLSEKPGY